MIMRYFFFFLFSFLTCSSLTAQPGELDRIRSYRMKNDREILNDFFSFLQIPNVAADTANIGKNASWLVQQMNTKGIENVSLLSLDEKNIPPVVYGEINVP